MLFFIIFFFLHIFLSSHFSSHFSVRFAQMRMEYRANNVIVGNPMTPAQNIRTTSIAWSAYYSAQIYTQWVSTPGVSNGSFTLMA